MSSKFRQKGESWPGRLVVLPLASPAGCRFIKERAAALGRSEMTAGTTEVIAGTPVSGTTGEVNCHVLPEVTITIDQQRQL